MNLSWGKVSLPEKENIITKFKQLISIKLCHLKRKKPEGNPQNIPLITLVSSSEEHQKLFSVSYTECMHYAQTKIFTSFIKESTILYRVEICKLQLVPYKYNMYVNFVIDCATWHMHQLSPI